MTDLFDFDNLPDVEGRPVSGPPALSGDTTPGDGPTLWCEVGGHEFVHTGRGRKPKNCPEHRTRTNTARGSATGVGSRGKNARVAALADDLTREFAIFGKGVARVLPTTGVVIVSRAEKTGQALAKIAASNPKVMAALEASTKILPALDLGETVAMVGIALLVDTGRLSPDGLLPGMLGVSEIWHDINDDGDVRGNTQPVAPASVEHVGMPEQDVPLRFQRIG